MFLDLMGYRHKKSFRVYRQGDPSVVYVVERSDGYVKVGYSRFVAERVKALSGDPVESRGPQMNVDGLTVEQVREIRKVRLVATAPGSYRQERIVHKKIEQFRAPMCWEWFRDTAECRRVIEQCFAVFRSTDDCSRAASLLGLSDRFTVKAVERKPYLGVLSATRI